MTAPGPDNPSARPLPDVPWDSVVLFVRQLSHDLRNHLNAAELQSAYLGEIADDPEIKEEIKRLRTMLSQLGGVLQKLSTDMGQARPTLMPYAVADLMEDLRRQLDTAEEKPAPDIEWDIQAGDAMVDIDPQLFPIAVRELLANAGRFAKGQPLRLGAARDASNHLVLTLSEPREQFEMPTENWGCEPLRSISQGHYGLGLNRARNIVEAHGGKLEARYDQAGKMLTSTITLPLSSEKS